jgi:hypothetical protein
MWVSSTSLHSRRTRTGNRYARSDPLSMTPDELIRRVHGRLEKGFTNGKRYKSARHNRD